MDDLAGLLDAIRARANDLERQSDMQPWSPLPAPATDYELAAAESSLGFPLPPAVRRVYGAVANGGFGPGYGLVGMAGGRAGFASGTGTSFCEDQYRELCRDPEVRWPSKMLPVCDWGCGIFSCVDAAQKSAPVLRVVGDALYDAPASAILPENCTFGEWLQAWTGGTDLWELPAR